MSSVDDRIVNMQFNNKQFIQGASDSQKALQGLDSTIAKTGSGSGLTTMGSAVDGISAKFSALQIAGVAALGTIVSKATTAGLGLIKSLTLDPITQGFSEYTTNLNSIQTVMANTGENVKTVNSYMQKLNEYSDQTIYNFSEMAKNIGTFTAAGVDLKTATSSIQGIANLAALSGSNSQQASTAMYQLSQAIAAGRVGLMDWNSVVNAGMGGKVFQTALAQTGQAMGTLSKNAVDLGGKMGKLTVSGESFRTSISATGGEAWLTGDVLTKTLSILDGRLASAAYAAKGLNAEQIKLKISAQQAKLAEDGYTKAQIKNITDIANRAYESATVVKSIPQLIQVVKESIGSIWANSFQIVLGDFEQSKQLWSDVSKHITGPTGILSKMGNSWTGMLKGWVDEGGRNHVIKGFSRLFRSLGRIMGTIKDAFGDIFPPSAGSTLAKVSKAFRDFTKNFTLSKDSAKELRSIFGGIFAVLHIGIEIIKGIGGAISSFFKAVFVGSHDAGGGILSLFGNIGEVLIAFDKWVTSGGKLTSALSKIGAIAGAFIAPLVSGLGKLSGLFNSVATPITTVSAKVAEMGSSISGVTTPITTVSARVAEMGDTATNASGTISGAFTKVKDVFNSLKDSFEGLFSSGTSLSSVFEDLGKNAGELAAKGVEIAAAIVSGLGSGLASAGPQIWEAIKSLATGIIDGFKSVLGIHSPATEMITIGIEIAAGIGTGIGEGLVAIITAIGNSGDAIKNAFSQLFGDMDALDIAMLMNSLFTGAFLLMLTQFGNSVATPFSKILREGVTSTFTELGNTLKTFQTGIKARALLDIAIAVGVLVASIVVLSLLDPKDIAISLGAIASMMGMLVGSMAVLGKTAKGGTDIALLAVSMTLISAAMINLAIAVAIFGNMDIKTLLKGLGAMAITLGILLLAMLGFSKVKGSIEGMAASIFVIALAMNAMALAVAALGSMDMGTLAKGLGAMAIGLGIFVAAMIVMDKMKSSPEGLAASILIMAGAMIVMSVAVASFGNMDMGTLAKGLGAVAIVMVLLVGSLLILAPMAPQVIVVAQAMALFAASMLVLAMAVGIFGQMSWEELGKGFAAVTVGLLLLLGAAALAQFVAPGLIILGVTIALLGAAMMMAGIGMMLFATGLALLTVVGVAATAVITAAIMAFLALLPSIAMQVAVAFVSFIEIIAKASPRIREAFSTIFREMLGVVIDVIPEIGKVLQVLITTGISILRKSIPQWIEMGFTIIDKFLQSAAAHAPGIIKSVTTLITTFMTEIGNNAEKIADSAAKMIIKFIKALTKAVEENDQDIRAAGLDLAWALINGMTGGLLTKGVDAIKQAAEDIAETLPGWMKKVLGIDSPSKVMMEIGFRVGEGLAKGILSSIGLAVAAAVAMANAVISEGDKSIAKIQKSASQKQGAAYMAQAKADLAAKRAAKAAKEKPNAKATKALQKEADRKQAKAEEAQRKADAAVEQVSDAKAFKEADLHGKGEIKEAQAVELADKAQQKLAQAEAEALEAKKLQKTNKAAAKRMLADSRKHAEEARKLAKAAMASQKEANAYYAQEVADRIKQIEDDAKADAKAKADEAAYNAADQAGKAEIMRNRALASQVEADRAKAEAARLIAEAKRIAKTKPLEAMKLLDEAEEQAALAKEAADRAEDERRQAEELLGGGGQSGGGTGGTGGIQPSRSVLEDAARAIDRYTESMQQAEELLGATQNVVQYTQNVYSPEALSAAEVYRQSRNLLTAEEIRIGQSELVDPYVSGKASPGPRPDPRRQTIG